MKQRCRRACLILATVVFGSFSGAAGPAPGLVSFSPNGSVKNISQATARFATDMVAMGDPRSLTDPFTIKCEAKVQPTYKTRWADSRNWSLDFDSPLKAGVKCAFNLKTDLKDLAGASVPASAEYSFTTSGPGILGVAPVYGNIEPGQYFVMQIDGEVDTESVLAHAYFEVEGLPDKVKVQFITGQPRDLVVRAAIKDNWQWYSFRDRLTVKPNDKTLSKEFDEFIVLEAKRKFPESAKVVFHWPKQVKSKSGIAVV
ncbi:MAG: Ig-like domain-containing protein, partial [Bdellovibrionia bacterium]